MTSGKCNQQNDQSSLRIWESRIGRVDTAVLRFSVLCRNFSLAAGPCSVPVGLARSLSICPQQTSWCLQFIVSCCANRFADLFSVQSSLRPRNTARASNYKICCRWLVLHFILRKGRVRLPVGSRTIPTADFRGGSPSS